MHPIPEPAGLHAHDLRHLLSLLACDLRLTRERLAGPAEDAEAQLEALLLRLDEGLAALAAALQGQGEALAAGFQRLRSGPAALIEGLWQSFLRAGRLEPEHSRLELSEPLLWPGDPAHWRSLVVNLLENACKAAPRGPVCLSAAAECLRVSNGGQLPPPGLVTGLREGRAPAPGPDGRGHGLNLILAAARALSLRLEIEETPSRFTLAFHRSAVDAPLLLLVEDDEDLRAMLAEYLRAEGFRVDDRADGRGLVPVPGLYAAAVADLNLPAGGGDELLAAWQEADESLLTILLTGDSEAAARHWPGVRAVLIKPGLGRLRELLDPLRGRSL